MAAAFIWTGVAIGIVALGLLLAGLLKSASMRAPGEPED